MRKNKETARDISSDAFMFDNIILEMLNYG